MIACTVQSNIQYIHTKIITTLFPNFTGWGRLGTHGGEKKGGKNIEKVR